ncbi:MAG: glycerate kinase [Clostridia bacterium]|nr:glycerate kinase [Clostridia bacterium]
MNILIAPDSFKGTLSAYEVCNIIEKAFCDVYPDANIEKLPVADGGEGLCACLNNIVGGETRTATVSGVFGEKMTASYLVLNDGTAVIETAACAGLPLAGENKNPLKATAYGVGELIKDAVKNGAENILLGLGGSATNECGLSVASALGWTFLDKNGEAFVPVGETLSLVDKIIPPKKPLSVTVTAACDVDNPLFGKNGAAYVFSPQKGADENEVELLDKGLRHVADIIERDLCINVKDLNGAGAAGGLGAGVVAFLNAKLRRGIDMILDIARFDEKLKNADLVITGEGRLDAQSVNGKVISGIATRAGRLNKTVITICGSHGNGAEAIKSLGVEKCFCATDGKKDFSEILKTCKEDLYNISVKAALSFKDR